LQCLDDTARAALVFSQPAYKGLASEQLGTRVVRTGPRPCPSFLMHHHPPRATRRPNPAVPQYIKMVVNLFFSPAATVRVEPARRAAEAPRCLCARTGGGRLFFLPLSFNLGCSNCPCVLFFIQCIEIAGGGCARRGRARRDYMNSGAWPEPSVLRIQRAAVVSGCAGVGSRRCSRRAASRGAGHSQ